MYPYLRHCVFASLTHTLSLSRSFSPPIPSLSAPLTLAVPSSFSASQVTMTGGFLASISSSVLPVCVCLPVSLSQPPGKQGATQQPVCDWAGLRGFLTQRGADCSGTCFNRWSRLESVITSERGLEERGCLPGAVWSPLSLQP